VQEELIDPAVRGTENALKTAIEAKVRRVILTSSMAAIMGRPTDKPSDECFDETDWNESSSLQGLFTALSLPSLEAP